MKLRRMLAVRISGIGRVRRESRNVQGYLLRATRAFRSVSEHPRRLPPDRPSLTTLLCLSAQNPPIHETPAFRMEHRPPRAEAPDVILPKFMDFVAASARTVSFCYT